MILLHKKKMLSVVTRRKSTVTLHLKVVFQSVWVSESDYTKVSFIDLCNNLRDVTNNKIYFIISYIHFLPSLPRINCELN